MVRLLKETEEHGKRVVREKRRAVPVRSAPALVSKTYEGAAGAAYSRGQGSPDVGAVLQAEFFQRYVSPEDSLLDFGCGKGGVTACLRAKRTDGFDVNVQQLVFARQRLDHTYAAYETVPEGIYDIVVSNHALEHCPAPIAALTFVKGWLKPSGRAVFIVPHDCSRQAHQRHFSYNDFDRHLFTWTPLTLGNLFREAGFEIEEARLIESAWIPRLLFVHSLPILGRISRRMTARLLGRYQVICVARRP